MYIIKAEASFDSAHFLHGYDGKCRNLHGHRWRIEVEAGLENLREEGQERGMIMDFSALKDAVKELSDSLDHAFIYEAGSLKEKTLLALREEDFLLIEVPFRPTAENFAEFVYNKISEKGFPVVRTAVYETPNNCAVYLPEEETEQ